MLVVVAILGVMFGIAVMMTSGVSPRTDDQMIQAECAEIRKAAHRFRADMGEPPRFLAELMQSPDPVGGWWWTDNAPSPSLRTYDPITRRGWNGPYLQSDFASVATQATIESRLVGTTTYERATSVLATGKRLTVLLSRYTTYPQQQDGSTLVSHYQLDFSDPNEIAVRFVKDPLAAADQIQIVTRLGLGLQP